ncbi:MULTISPECIES: YncE family protein [unclassified Ruegeria]|jgi:YVTN family beta-propeller protein|uniref:YncE family protein n=1 Tax=unclassified Ruegeria TaxID=2625375 RepID=UPI001491E8E0|nr:MULTISPECIES: YncE family protein [unclassified Ruegeria]MBO9448275.1 PQQ-binding-like beta-propeller repeat protein [Ruegeria sp. R14_0]NOD90815.1 PQQ-binding-like beta-propeller repeat protein [Ruegeria sp. HKCCD4318]NOE15988.1 PQQ-binding-like beta-propeller repeat protein [Ruegeria sp. HKCCD4318-2]NOG11629.1 PQQ-binding-like beta-propeller repeat protein [Ruegeria sp. HKCCD4315]UUV08535.1 PQQ-binding-like beta-propeller repeat protein [Ruegeria sp. YS9]
MTLFNLAAGLSVAALTAPSLTLAATVFIPEGSADSVLVIDSETGKTVERLPRLVAVHGLAGAPGFKYLVAGSYAETEATTPPKPEGMSEDEHAAHHAKRDVTALPKDKGRSLLTILDAETREVVRQIEVPGAVHHTAVSPDGRFAVATHPGGDGISIVDLDKLSFLGFVATGPMPNYAVFAPDSDRVYVTNTGNGTLSEVDVVKGFVVRNMPVGEGPEHLVLNATGSVAFVADSDGGKAFRVDLASGSVTETYDIGGELHGIGLSDREGVLFVAAKGTDRLLSIDLATGKQRSTNLSPAPYHLTTIPNSGKVMVSSRTEPKVWIVDQVSLTAITEMPILGEGHQMVVLP